ncbi:MAG: glycosyl transferase family 36 [Desulfuromonadaceae bacterium]|nr:glycosyl transferase family 36 [Desulfuromonadaceae bacterium]
MSETSLRRITGAPRTAADILFFVCGVLAAAASAFAAGQGSGWKSALYAGILGLLAATCFRYQFTRRGPRWGEALQYLLVPLFLGLAVDPGIAIWQVPKSWPEIFLLTGLAGACFILINITNTLRSLAAVGRPPQPLSALALALIPFLFNGLLILGTPDPIATLGSPAALFGPTAATIFGRTLLLGFFNEVIGNLFSLLVVRRWISDLRLHLLLIGTALLASATPECASWGSGPFIASLPHLAALPAALAAAMFSQAGLWAETFLITGLIMDALHHKKPTWYWGSSHFRSGLTKGAIYSLLFLALIQTTALILRTPALSALIAARPLISAAFIGAVAFPFFQTIIESFDGSEPFLIRARRNYRQWSGLGRGAAVGLFVASAFFFGLPKASGPDRFLFGLVAGMTAYAGVDMLRDIFLMARGRRQRLQSWRVYALAAFLGGLAGGGLAWYVDLAQLQVLIGKFFKYAALHYPQAGMMVENYVIYPLFSKWGVMNLGASPGAVRLFYNEALSGVINWSLAAPLFSVNLLLLNALLQRSLTPLRELFSHQGMVTLVEQALRVLRWGLWMAPVIYSFLRMSPDPAWYNQDGAFRTLIAIFQSWALEPAAFRSWSLDLFLNMLIHDWLRITIWVDHMGLRVATLVNLSFVGADILDEKAARAIGHSARTRCIPEGLRRFATWAPLLIPFYLPRGADWDYVWNTSAARAAELAGSVWPPLYYLVGGFLAAMVIAAFFLVPRRRQGEPAPRGHADPESTKMNNVMEKSYLLSNGRYSAEIYPDGRGYSRVFSAVNKGFEVDITRRPDDPLQMRGKFFYLGEENSALDGSQSWWPATGGPTRSQGEDYRIAHPDPLTMEFVHRRGGIRAETRLSIDADEPLERWRLRLINLEQRPRVLELISYQELAMNNTDAYRRHPFYNHLHLGTRFVPSANAILAQNRLNKSAERDPSRRRISGETAFHAVREDMAQGITLTGWEDDRCRFIGMATLAHPAALDNPMKAPEEREPDYTFDPIASLRLRVELAPLAAVEVLFVDGYAPSEAEAFRLLARHVGTATAKKPSKTEPRPENMKDPLPWFRYSDDGRELSVPWKTCRPWHHMMANPLGYGALVSNHGACYSFMKNSQQNGLTPFDSDSVPSQLPGQVLYLHDLAGKESATPFFIPLREKNRDREVLWGLGYAIYRSRNTTAEMEMTHFILPDQPAELRLVKIRNLTGTSLQYRVVPYFQIMLGETPVDTLGKIETAHDPELQALLFSNPANDFWKGWAFAAASFPVEAVETVRRRFVGGPERDLGRPFLVTEGTPDASQADDGFRCAALCGTVTVPANGETEFSVIFGQAGSREEAAALITSYQDVDRVHEALERTRKWWPDYLPKKRAASGDREIDRLVEVWLPYQILVSRLWGRLGPYQRSGAFGFRDQLQDVLPLISSHPDLARKQILLHAGQQFAEGDVLHWWHQTWEEKTGIGLRGRASDPHLWLPYMVCRYVSISSDVTILEETVPFLEGPRPGPLSPGKVVAPRPSRDTATLYEHCRRAVELTLSRKGRHGLPLLGAGDWNDGLDTAGFKGLGESVWMGFFLHGILVDFADLADKRGDGDLARRFDDEAAALKKPLDAMWRQDRYVRLITDDGQEMNRIDALMAAWPILSAGAVYERGVQAMATALRELEQARLVQLFAPPCTEREGIYPGRLADYPPGVRENGGQYSHGVSWLIDALLVLSRQAEERGHSGQADIDRRRAEELWRKISPLARSTPEGMAVYGLPPHQQAADIYFGPGYEGRGGWSWYTGAAARMLYAAQLLYRPTETEGREN